MQPIRVVLVDDHVMFRRGLASLMAQSPELAVVGEAGDGLEALETAQRTTPDVVLMDVNMPRCDGVAGARLIREAMPEVRVIMLTVSDDDADLFEAIKAGASGYLLKNLTPETLFESVRGVMNGEAPLSSSVAARILAGFRDLARESDGIAGSLAALSSRENQILQLVADGLSNKEIGAQLYIAPGTVKNHLHNILDKLHVQNRAEAASFAAKAGLVRSPGGPQP